MTLRIHTDAELAAKLREIAKPRRSGLITAAEKLAADEASLVVEEVAKLRQAAEPLIRRYTEEDGVRLTDEQVREGYMPGQEWDYALSLEALEGILALRRFLEAMKEPRRG